MYPRQQPHQAFTREKKWWLGAESNRRFKDQKCADPLPEPFSEENQQNTREMGEIIEFKFLYAMI